MNGSKSQNPAGHRIAVTTAVNDTPELIEQARRIALELNANFIERNERPMHALFAESGCSVMLCIRRDRFVLENSDGEEYQFHPNLAIVRAANFLKHGSDRFLETVNLRSGELLLDCTIGFGSEALLAAMAVGPDGEVVGLESVPELAVITREGMRRYKLQQKKLEEIMRRVVVLNRDYREYLKDAPTQSYDVVYFDPFFDRPLDRSTNSIAPLAAFGNRAPLDTKSVIEARRVARRIVVVKHTKWHRLPAEIESQVSDKICGRRSTVAYSVLPGFGSSAQELQ